MALLIAGLVVFLGIHSIHIVNPHLRERVVGKVGRAPWMIGFSLISFLGFVLIIYRYKAARPESIDLYAAPEWLSPFSSFLMVFAFVFFVSSQISGRIAQRLKHPQLVAVKTWAVAHLISNGDLVSVILFGSFLIWAVADRISLKKRVAAGLASDKTGDSVAKDVVAIAVGLALYGLFAFWAHFYLFGVHPIH